MTPKVFLSYSWSSPGHQATVKEWADRLIADGVDVVLDIYDFKEGQDKFAFMEKMVADATISHVLLLSDRAYAEKANSRKSGVGTESQIISKEVYEKVDQSKFLPVVCEKDPSGEPCLPTFVSSRKWIDFSTPEAVNENWEQLVRVLYGKPFYVKPAIGKVPAYLTETEAPSSPAIAKFHNFRQAILHAKPGLKLYRQDFLDSCMEYADSLRVRKAPQGDLAQLILADCGKLRSVRNHIVDWVLLEAGSSPSGDFSESLLLCLERLRALKSRPSELRSYNEHWFEAHSIFVYETFLYIVAALIKAQSFEVLHDVFASHYLRPLDEQHGAAQFDNFDVFYGYSKMLDSVLAEPGTKLRSPAAELIRRQADRGDLPFDRIMEAELVVLLMTFIKPEVRWWPQTLIYSSYSRGHTFFIRAAQHKNFQKLATITGIADVEKLRNAVEAGRERSKIENSDTFFFARLSISEALNIAKWDTLK
ncbi:SEFIR domain-containing protein [Humisphaera borealis]|uniref:TIR domain-containing protein n=1 Tax=Humisphaera borealis TaxID=2807512 RepID=A0A7M2X4X2_9BACT|nr:TIR domain-containing protein [Humisphaera borealis]QOV91830.1 TIR domain-containing protein [Humisphaera borealis]